MPLDTGTIIGDYEVMGLLGAGGMGTVYKVRNLISDRVDAMKILLPDLKDSADLADRFLNEIKVLASLSHPNIAALHTAFRTDNQLLMVMEFVQGENLDQRLQRGPIPITASLQYVSQILSALQYAHSRGVVHRDIKPANIAVQFDEVVKLLDFGIARAGSLRLTRTGMVLGSLYYMSPEQVHGQMADARSDLYSLGITLYRMLTGRRPIEGENEFAVMRAQVSEVPISPREYNSAVPQEVADAVLRALMKDPAQRFQSAAEFQGALEPLLRTSAPSYSGEHYTATMRTPPGGFVVPGTTPILGTTPIPSSAMFDSATLARLQKHLAGVIGPIAGALVKKHSLVAGSLEELCRLLAAEIPTEAGRRGFVKNCQKESGVESLEGAGPMFVTPVPVPAQSVAWDPLLLERSRKDLALFIGPLAKIIVERAARKARTTAELYALIGAEIPSPKDREKFLASR